MSLGPRSGPLERAWARRELSQPLWWLVGLKTLGGSWWKSLCNQRGANGYLNLRPDGVWRALGVQLKGAVRPCSRRQTRVSCLLLRFKFLLHRSLQDLGGCDSGFITHHEGSWRMSSGTVDSRCRMIHSGVTGGVGTSPPGLWSGGPLGTWVLCQAAQGAAWSHWTRATPA